MRWTKKLSDNIKKGIRNWLQITPSSPYAIQINEVMDFELSAIRNRIWYRGDGNELEQMYQQNPEYADKTKFWASKCTPGMEMRKIHTGLPALMVRVLSEIVLSDMNDFKFDNPTQKALWDEITQKSKFRKKLKKALKEILCIGDGAWKIVINTKKSKFPRLVWYPGDRVELIQDEDELQEVIFKTPYTSDRRRYVLHEHYGFGFVRYELYHGDKSVDIGSIKETKMLKDCTFDSDIILAVPMMVFDSTKFDGRGGSIFDGKLDSYDALDEAWSQWMDALREGRAKTYIPECLVPHDPQTGQAIKPNPFDNRYFAADGDMSEGQKNVINTVQPAIPHESYLASYVTALDLCLQGVISPSTLGIDMKKLDNAEAQREKEKATLYTRNAIVEMLEETLPDLVATSIHAYNILTGATLEDVKVDIPFGEYANPSFESQVETVSKGKQGGIMSIEAAVEELYGDSRDDEWKAAEIERLKAEQGIADLNEPGIMTKSGDFEIGLQAGGTNAGKDNEPGVPDEPTGVQGTAKDSK